MCFNYWRRDVLKINENGSFLTPQPRKTFLIYVYILHWALLLMSDLLKKIPQTKQKANPKPDLFFASCVHGY